MKKSTAQKAEAPTGFSHRFSTNNKVNIHYLLGGNGPAIMLIHGFPQTWYAWRKVMVPLAERFTVIVPDLRGLGDSDLGDCYDKVSVANDLVLLIRELDVGSTVLVSGDMGTPVAYALAVDNPELVSRFVAFESGIPGFGLEALMDVTSGGAWHFGFFISEGFPEMLIKGRERKFLTALGWHGSAYNKEAIGEDALNEYTRCYTAEGALQAAMSYYRTLPQDAMINKARSNPYISMPTLIIETDRGIPNVASMIQPVTRDVKILNIDNCGHWVAEEQPKQLLKELSRFLS